MRLIRQPASLVLFGALAAALSACAADANPEASSTSRQASVSAMSEMAAAAPSAMAPPTAPSMAPTPAATASATAMAPAPGSAMAPEAAPARLEAPAGQVAPEVTGTEGLQQAGLAIEASLAAAAAIEGTDTCDTAYRGLSRMLDEMRRRMPDAVSERGMPPREDFIELCRQLPPELQSCLQIGYAMQHQQECQAQRENLDPAIAARLEALMQNGSGG